MYSEFQLGTFQDLRVGWEQGEICPFTRRGLRYKSLEALSWRTVWYPVSPSQQGLNGLPMTTMSGVLTMEIITASQSAHSCCHSELLPY